jgi:prevent-host-death family protein
MIVNIHEAKTNFSKIIARALSGEEVIISRSGKPVAQLVPIKEKLIRRVPGSARGKLVMHDNFVDPLPDDVLESFES